MLWKKNGLSALVVKTIYKYLLERNFSQVSFLKKKHIVPRQTERTFRIYLANPLEFLSLIPSHMKTNLRNAPFSNSKQRLAPDYSYIKMSWEKEKINPHTIWRAKRTNQNKNCVRVNHTVLTVES